MRLHGNCSRAVPIVHGMFVTLLKASMFLSLSGARVPRAHRGFGAHYGPGGAAEEGRGAEEERAGAVVQDSVRRGGWGRGGIAGQGVVVLLDLNRPCRHPATPYRWEGRGQGRGDALEGSTNASERWCVTGQPVVHAFVTQVSTRVCFTRVRVCTHGYDASLSGGKNVSRG